MVDDTSEEFRLEESVRYNNLMIKDTTESWLDDFCDDLTVQSKRKDNPRKSKKESEKTVCVGDNNKSKAFARLCELDIPKSAQTLLTKLIANGQLTSVNQILFRKKKSIIISGKANQKHRNFPTLSSDDVIIKILINGNKSQLWKRAYDESHQEKYVNEGDNRPTFLLQTGNIIVTSMIGKDGQPAPTLKDILNSNQRDIVAVYNEVIQFWCKTRNMSFHPSNFLYHGKKWWRVGCGGGHINETIDTNFAVRSLHYLSFYRSNLKYLIDFFCNYGLSLKEAEIGFMKYGTNYCWYTQQIIRGMTRKRSFFSIMYS